MSLAGRVGTGNIVGVSTAIFIGGPGAVFWMWISAFLGASSAFIESTLGQIFKREDKGEYRGGPAYYIEYGIGGKFGKIYGLVFAIVTVISVGLLLPGVQSNAIASSMHNAFNVPNWIVAIIVVIILALIIFGGLRSIANVATAVVPFMAVIYILMAIVIIIINIQHVPALFALIFKSAFGLQSAFGGIVGAMIEIGVKEGYILMKQDKDRTACRICCRSFSPNKTRTRSIILSLCRYIICMYSNSTHYFTFRYI